MLREGLVQGTRWGLFIFVLVMGSSMVIQALLPWEPGPQPFAEMVMSARSVSQVFATALIGVLLAPLGEELLFRGFLYPALRGKFGTSWAIVLSAAIFGALHLDLLRFLPLAVGGVGLAWLYERSRTLYAPITAHAVWNAAMLSLLYIAGTGAT